MLLPGAADHSLPLAHSRPGRWALLAEDTAPNEAVRRLQIHRMLAPAGPVQPLGVAKRLYKEVLNADLEDPRLGLGKILSSSYPFAKEELR